MSRNCTLVLPSLSKSMNRLRNWLGKKRFSKTARKSWNSLCCIRMKVGLWKWTLILLWKGYWEKLSIS